MYNGDSGRWTRRQFVQGISAAGLVAAGAGPAAAQSTLTADASIQELKNGNKRYIAGKLSSFPEDLKILQEKTVSKQEPFAAVLACADSRVPVEILFDQTIGHLFVVRVAGNVVTPEIMASLEYAVVVLGVKALLVMGHSNCGAVSAAVAAKEVPGQISVLYQHLMPGIAPAKGDLGLSVKMNAAYQAQILRQSSTVIAKAIKNDGVKVLSGVYDLGSGSVEFEG
jgi:carbonic anhydrase